jgi:hypothetical protein
VGNNIFGIRVPQVGENSHIKKINDSLRAMDNHDHSPGKGAPVKALDAAAVDNSTVEHTNTTQVRLKASGITGAKLASSAVDGLTVKIIQNKLTVADSGLLDVKFEPKLISNSASVDPGADGIVDPPASTNVSISTGGADRAIARFTPRGRPVMGFLLHNSAVPGTNSVFTIDNTGGGLTTVLCSVNFYREDTPIPPGPAVRIYIAEYFVAVNFDTTAQNVSVPISSFSFVDYSAKSVDPLLVSQMDYGVRYQIDSVTGTRALTVSNVRGFACEF